MEETKPEADEIKSNGSAASNGVSKEGTPNAAANGTPLTYEEELCMKLEEEARWDYRELLLYF